MHSELSALTARSPLSTLQLNVQSPGTKANASEKTAPHRPFAGGPPGSNLVPPPALSGIGNICGTKRPYAPDAFGPAPVVSCDSPPSDQYDDDDEDILQPGMVMDQSPNQIRGKLRRLIDSGEMTVKALLEELGVSSRSYYNFMGAQVSKTGGANSDTYDAAWAFFKRREMRGIKEPTAKRAKTDTGRATAKGATNGGARGKSDDKDGIPDLSGIILPGEQSGDVEVYDTCDMVRRKISAFLRNHSSQTASSFTRLLNANLCGPAPAADNSRKGGTSGTLQAAQLTRFRGQKGVDAGNTSLAFYAAYVFFEKLRLAEGKPKSKERQGMEDTWAGRGGFEIRRPSGRGFLCGPDRRPVMDKFGQVSFHKI